MSNPASSTPPELPVRTLAMRLTLVAGIFVAVVVGMMVFGLASRHGKDPLDAPGYLALKQELIEHPGDVVATEGLRQLDLQLRQEYFGRRRFIDLGIWLLAGGLLVFFVAARWANSTVPISPHPEPIERPIDLDTRTTRIARWSVAVSALLTVAGGIALATLPRNTLPADLLAEARLRAEQTAGGTPLVTRVHTDTPPDQATQPNVPPEVPSNGAVTDTAPTVTLPPEPDDLPDIETYRRNWPRFRGPDGSGISQYDDMPTEWDEATGKNIAWKTEVPLPGNNSPIVWEGRVFLSGADEEHREVYCFDADAGTLLWRQPVPTTPETPTESHEVSEDTGQAAPTMATDGVRVFAMFANGDLVAMDLDGNVTWSRGFGAPENHYGHATSLVVHRNLLLVQLDQGEDDDDQSNLWALDVTNGETVWKAPRAVTSSWTTPIVIEAAGRTQVITAADPWAIAYDVTNGGEIWRAKVLRSEIGPSPVFADGLVFTATEYLQSAAIRPDGTGDVTETHVAWTGEDGLPDTASPLATAELCFLLNTYGILTCLDAKEGTFLYDHELQDAVCYSSPSMVGSNLYIFGDVEEEVDDDWVYKSNAWILKPSREGVELVGSGKFEEACVTCPAFAEGRIFIRGKRHLYCLTKHQPAAQARQHQPAAQARQHQPAAQARQHQPAAQARQHQPAAQARQHQPAAQARQHQPAAQARPTPTRSASKATPTRSASKATPTRSASKATPTRGASKATPTRGASKATPTRSASKATPTRGASKATPTRSASKATPTRSASKATPTRSASKATPTRSASKATPTRSASKATPTRGASKATPTRGASKATPTRSAGKATPTRSASKATPTRSASKATPTRSASKATPTRGASKATPTRSASKATPTRGASKATPTRSASKATPTRSASKATPTRSASKATPTRSASKATPTRSASKATPTRGASKANTNPRREPRREPWREPRREHGEVALSLGLACAAG